MIGVIYPEAKKFARQIARSQRWLGMTAAEVKARIARYAPPGMSGSSEKLAQLKRLYREGHGNRSQALRLLVGDYAYKRLRERADQHLAEVMAAQDGCAY